MQLFKQDAVRDGRLCSQLLQLHTVCAVTRHCLVSIVTRPCHQSAYALVHQVWTVLVCKQQTISQLIAC